MDPTYCASRCAAATAATRRVPAVSLERNVPVRLSSPGEPAREPAISGERVILASARPLDGESLGLRAVRARLVLGRGVARRERARRPARGALVRRAARLARRARMRATCDRVGSCRRTVRAAICRGAGSRSPRGPRRVRARSWSGPRRDSGKQRLRACRWQGRSRVARSTFPRARTPSTIRCCAGAGSGGGSRIRHFSGSHVSRLSRPLRAGRGSAVLTRARSPLRESR
jgi:hypothetical protein